VDRLQVEGLTIADERMRPALREATLGTFMFVHSYPSLLAWAVMYYTVSNISHVCMYRDPGFVMDVTTSGVQRHAATDYIDERSFILLLKVDAKNMRPEMLDQFEHSKFNWYGAIRLGFRAVLGCQTRFRWAFLCDTASIVLPMVSLLLWFGHVKAAGMCLAVGISHATIATINRYLLRSRTVSGR
jgi:hypothetical protein